MNFSSFGNMMFTSTAKIITTDVNTFTYINRFAKNIAFDFSGTASTVFPTNTSYAPSSFGLNPGDEKTTFARLLYNSNYLKSSDFCPDSSSSFTIYVKHAARYSNLPPFNFQNPNVVAFSQTVVLSGSSFTASFYSSLDPGTVVPYSITGCSSAELGGAALTGVLTAPYKNMTYSIAAGVVGRNIQFNVSGGTMIPAIYVPDVVYVVTVVGGVFWLATGGAAALQQPGITFATGLIYVFDQSHASNVGNTLVLGQTLDSTPYYTTNVVTNGTAGSASACTLINLVGQTLPSPALKYFSRNTAEMGSLPTAPDAPMITSGTTNSGITTVTFTEPPSTGGSEIVSYTATVYSEQPTNLAILAYPR